MKELKKIREKNRTENTKETIKSLNASINASNNLITRLENLLKKKTVSNENAVKNISGKEYLQAFKNIESLKKRIERKRANIEKQYIKRQEILNRSSRTIAGAEAALRNIASSSRRRSGSPGGSRRSGTPRGSA